MVGRGPLGRVGFTSAPGCLRQEGVGEALGGVTGLPALLPCLAPSHACPFALPWEEVAGWSWGGGSHSYKATQALFAKGISGWGGHMQKGLRGVGSALCPPPLPPPHGPQAGKVTPASASREQGGGGSESSGPVSFLRNLHPPPNNPGPWGECSAGGPPEEGASADRGILWALRLLQRGCQVGDSCLHGLY